MKVLHGIDRAVVIQLARASSGLNAFTLSRRLRVSAAELAKAYVRLSKAGLIVNDGSHFEMTSTGREFLLTAHISLNQPEERPWRRCPDNFQQPAIARDSPIVPWLPLVDDAIVPKVIRAKFQKPKRNRES